jgi:hypothetical protein
MFIGFQPGFYSRTGDLEILVFEGVSINGLSPGAISLSDVLGQRKLLGEKLWCFLVSHMAVCQNLVPLVNIKIAGKWMFIPLKMVLIGIDQ